MNSTNEDRLAEIEQRLEAVEQQTTKLEERIFTGPAPVGSEYKPLSVQEFLSGKKPTPDVQKTLLTAYYLEKFGGGTFQH